MEEAYKTASGFGVEAVSDIGLRLRVLAGELYREQAEVEWIRRQSFPETASGEQLDQHGAQRGVLRKEATKAEGSITFTRYIPITFDLLVPKGTVCASSGEEAVEYETTEEAVLPAGEVAVTVPARAVEAGAKGNAAESYINTLVTPVTGIQYASNRVAFTGGADAEDEESYRARVAEAYRRPMVCGNAAYYEQIAKGLPGITSAQAVADAENPGTVLVYLWGEGAAPTAEVLASATAALNEKKAMGAVLDVRAATSKKINLYLRMVLPAGMVLADVKTDVENALRAWLLKRQVGDPVQPADVIRVGLDAAPGVVRMEMTASMMGCDAAVGVIPIPGGIAAGLLT